ncbi:OLC1v1015282C1 [Oldenlandia corymbosa var. corymbosa]|uniref:OLC1v1015282C1 n=1 Tax=Oldenlandia corymbosa var. corymbosa TaxID=529605 RepID=A0AAV1E695_OLDCO|nr:OLC1v1015282C1 [Oldenlandia corymbosa var. corymbosa]
MATEHYKVGDDNDHPNHNENFRYLIVKPQNGGIRDLARFFYASDAAHKFLEVSDDGLLLDDHQRGNRGDDGGETPYHKWVIFVSIVVRKIIAFVGKPMEWIGYLVEFLLNLLSNNGGFFSLLFNILHGKLVLPQRGSETFISAIGHLDGRINLYQSYESFPRSDGETDPLQKSVQFEIGSRSLMDLCIMASKLAYENALVVKNVVNLHWKMHFVDFFNCWNDYEKDNSTQVFIMCDKPKDANLILISFRGTEPFDADDWITDFDYSWYEVPKLGKVHMGFLEALGLGSRRNASSFQENLRVVNNKTTSGSDESSTTAESDAQDGGSDHSSDSEQQDHKRTEKFPLMAEKTAYYAVRSKLMHLLREHKNAKFVVTGHSLGGALAVLFPVVLVLHDKDEILQRMLAVYTYGQPRVGNRQLGRSMEAHLSRPILKYFRVVYCNDLVPRLPYDDKTFLYKHFGACLYYNSLYIEQKVDEEPNPNYFGIRFLIPEYLNAGWELVRSFLAGYVYGPEYKEDWESTLLRIVGLGIPGLSAHSPVDYVTSVRLGREKTMIQMSSL